MAFPNSSRNLALLGARTIQPVMNDAAEQAQTLCLGASKLNGTEFPIKAS